MAKRKTGKKKKLPWTSMEITKVRLNPEQAVLACCDLLERSDAEGPEQCRAGCVPPGAVTTTSS